MPRVSDCKVKPGDIVLIRGGLSIVVWQEPGLRPTGHVGEVTSSACGLVISDHVRSWAYVLWSSPLIIGWVPDGFLRSVKVQ